MMFYIHLLRKCKINDTKTVCKPICFEQLYIIYIIYENHWYSCVFHTPRKPIQNHDTNISFLRKTRKGYAETVCKPIYLNGCAPTPETL